MKLTRQQYQNLEQYLVEFRARLNQTTTREEAVPFFKEAVVELNKYGLLPRGMSVEQAQRLVTGWNQKSDVQNDNQNFIKRILNIGERLEIFPNFVNVFCLLSISAAIIPNQISMILPIGPLIMFIMIPLRILSIIGAIDLASLLSTLLTFIYVLNPFRLMNYLAIMNCNIDLQSFGLKGKVEVNENNGINLIFGYTGLMFFGFSKTSYFLGSALGVAKIFVRMNSFSPVGSLLK